MGQLSGFLCRPGLRMMPSEHDGARHREIVAYLEERLQRGKAQVASGRSDDGLPPWLAIDDSPALFPEEVIGRQIRLTESGRPFDVTFEAKLRAVIKACVSGA